MELGQQRITLLIRLGWVELRLTDGDDHETGGETEGQREARVLVEAFDVFAQDGRQEGGDERSCVDGEVEDGEELLQLLILLGTGELVAAEGRNAGLDAARSQRDHHQTNQRKMTNSTIQQFNNSTIQQFNNKISEIKLKIGKI